MSGYVAILTGRSRSTEDIDTILEPLSDSRIDRLAERLTNEGYWGMGMPLDDLTKMLTAGDRLRVAEEGEMYPNFEVWLASNDTEREALSTAIFAEVGEQRISISRSRTNLRWHSSKGMSNDWVSRTTMLNSKEFERSQQQNVEERRAFIKRWAEYIRTHDDEEWSRQQNKLIDSQLQSANELARQGDTDPVEFLDARERHQRGAE